MNDAEYIITACLLLSIPNFIKFIIYSVVTVYPF